MEKNYLKDNFYLLQECLMTYDYQSYRHTFVFFLAFSIPAKGNQPNNLNLHGHNAWKK